MMLSLVYGRHGTVLPLDIIWQAILGLTDQHLRNHVTEEWYERYCNYLRGELLDHFIDGPKRLASSCQYSMRLIINVSAEGNIR